MVADILRRARHVFDLLEAGRADPVTALLSSRVRAYVGRGDWSVAGYLDAVWRPGLDGLAGPPGRREVVASEAVSDSMARFVVSGPAGRAFVGIRFDETGDLDGLSIDAEVFDGVHNIVVNCPADRVDDLRALYDALLGADPRRFPRLVFDEGRGYVPPRWPDPAHPQQMHLDISCADLDESHAVAIAHGAEVLHDRGHHRTYADPVGHPFCLYPGNRNAIDRVVIDCPDAPSLAQFYRAFLGMDTVLEERAGWTVIAGDDPVRPKLAFQSVAGYHRPTWPDPPYPQQVHFDVKFDDRDAAADRAVALGATPLPPQGGSCPVFADPAGHPFCLCLPGE